MGLLTLAISLSAQAFVSCSARGDNCPAAAAGLQESNYTKGLAVFVFFLTAVTACQVTLVLLFHHYVKETSHPLPLLYNKAKHV